MPPDLSGMDRRCGAGDTISRGAFTLENNAWGAGQVSAFEQCVYATPAGDRLAWTWDYPIEAPNDVKAYPEVIFGKKPFTPGPSTTPLLPRPVSPVPSLRVDFSRRTELVGRANAAFEIWLTNEPAAPEGSITHEIMFWVGHEGDPRPAGTLARTVTLADGRTADLWVGTVRWWRYLAFVFRQPVGGGVIEFGYYLDDLLRHGEIPPTAFIAVLEYGNEVWYGNGWTVLDRYQVTVAGGVDLGPVPVPEPEPEPEPEPQPEPEPEPEPPQPPARDPLRGYIRVEVPAAARVLFEGVLTRQTGSVRVFGSTILEPGQDYQYHVRVELDGPDGLIVAERAVFVRAGTEVTESFWAALQT